MNVLIPARVQVGGKLNEWTADPNQGMKAGRNAGCKLLTFPDQPELTDVIECKSVTMFDNDLGQARVTADASIGAVMGLTPGETIWVTGKIKTYQGRMTLTVLSVERIATTTELEP